MKRSLNPTRFLMIATLLTLSAVAASAQCDTHEVTALYNKLLQSRKGPLALQTTTAEVAKEYLAKFGECPGEYEQKIAAWIKQWQSDYEVAVADLNCTNAANNNPLRALELCQPYVAKQPESLRPYLLLSLAGIKNA